MQRWKEKHTRKALTTTATGDKQQLHGWVKTAEGALWQNNVARSLAVRTEELEGALQPLTRNATQNQQRRAEHREDHRACALKLPGGHTASAIANRTRGWGCVV